ncbi:MAG: CDP-2,3-bis-(O-geranylgeranyl)-sn-glycerol synthase [Desulfurococcales archaeon]|nr:CDP-2,3-bis-(O-geranylgeranyl)-sn-glycerol synthase [Desulfurococcales archaeon]
MVVGGTYHLVHSTLNLLLLIIPAMVANGTPVVVGKLVRRPHPIDNGKTFWDGRRILGDGKTWEGLIGGVLAGLIIGAILGVALSNLPFWLETGFWASLGAMIGDLAGSFAKRRMGLSRGDPAPLLDQLDFYVGALIFLYLAGAKVEIVPAIILAPLVYALHRLTNMLAYRFGIKREPH